MPDTEAARGTHGNGVNAVREIRNLVLLDDGTATAGQPRREQLPLIAAAGYRAVINLAMPDHEDSYDDEGALVTALAMAYIHIPVPFDAPTGDHVRRFCHTMTAWADQPVFVHCIMNYRVSAFMFHYRHKVLGMDQSTSRSPMFQRWSPDPVWQELLQRSADDLGLY